MNLWGFTVDRTLGWILVTVLCILIVAAYLYAVRFVRKYASGMMGGFILLMASFGMILGPIFHLISNVTTGPDRMLCGTAIFLGCISFVVGAFELRSYGDF